jgi:hypothetical protein
VTFRWMQGDDVRLRSLDMLLGPKAERAVIADRVTLASDHRVQRNLTARTQSHPLFCLFDDRRRIQRLTRVPVTVGPPGTRWILSEVQMGRPRSSSSRSQTATCTRAAASGTPTTSPASKK